MKHEFLLKINYKSGNSIEMWFLEFEISGSEVKWVEADSTQRILKIGVDDIESIVQLDAREVQV